MSSSASWPRGIHPQILSEAGLGAALQSLADRSPVDVTIDSGTSERFSAAVEGTAYFVVSEALANVAKYAQATRAVVRTAWSDDALTVEIADDGIGGADSAAGSGLRAWPTGSPPSMGRSRSSVREAAGPVCSSRSQPDAPGLVLPGRTPRPG